jgi:hypothetical protein
VRVCEGRRERKIFINVVKLIAAASFSECFYSLKRVPEVGEILSKRDRIASIICLVKKGFREDV